MGRLYGQEGLLFEDMRNSLKEPGSQAILILVGSVVVAGGCFLFAKFPAIEDNRFGIRHAAADVMVSDMILKRTIVHRSRFQQRRRRVANSVAGIYRWLAGSFLEWIYRSCNFPVS